MSVSKTILDNATVPSGEFGDFAPEGNPPGIIQFTNHGSVSGRITVLGSNDGVNWDNIFKLKARSGVTKIKRVKVPAHIKFHNARAAFGPATLILVNAE